MFHAASMGGILGIPACGASSTFVPIFEPKAVLENIETHGVTMTVMVPTMIAMLLAHPDFEPERMRSLEVLTYGVADAPRPARPAARAVPDLDVYQGYGMTESSAVLTALGPDDHRAGGDLLRSAGRPLAGVVLSIQDGEGKALPRVRQERCAPAPATSCGSTGSGPRRRPDAVPRRLVPHRGRRVPGRAGVSLPRRSGSRT